MNKNKFFNYVAVSLLIVISNLCLADTGWGVKFSDAIIQRYQPTIDAATHHGWDHSNSVVMHGMEKIYLKTKNKAYLEYIQRYADTFIEDDGSIKKLRSTLDGMHPGVICMFLYRETGDKKYLKAAKVMREHFLGMKSPFQKTPDGLYWHKNIEKYRNVASVDGLYMVYPFLVQYGNFKKDDKAIETAVQQILLVSERSFNIKFGLPYHAWNYDKIKPWAHPITGTSTQFWSRASGWYSMALVDVLEFLPKDHPDYSKVLNIFQTLAEGLKEAQNPNTGFWYQVLDKSQDVKNYPEVSGTGMITYALQKGVNLKFLDSSFKKVAQKGWLALTSKLTRFDDGGPQVNSVAPGMGAKNNYEEYLSVVPVSVPSRDKKQHMHGYMAVLMAASVME